MSKRYEQFLLIGASAWVVGVVGLIISVAGIVMGYATAFLPLIPSVVLVFGGYLFWVKVTEAKDRWEKFILEFKLVRASGNLDEGFKEYSVKEYHDLFIKGRNDNRNARIPEKSCGRCG